MTRTTLLISHESYSIPVIAQGNPSGTISCDVPNGASYNAGEITAINWTLSGYVGFRYVLLYNYIAVDFGQIATNTSFLIHHVIGEEKSWQNYGIQIYEGNALITEQYVSFEVKEGFWNFNTIFLLISGSVVGIAISTDVIMWRKVKRVRSRREEFQPVIRPIPEFQSNSGVLTSLTPEEEADYTKISAMRVLRICLWNSDVQDFYQSWVIREDLANPKRYEVIEREVGQILHHPQFKGLQGVQFLNVVSMQESDRLVAIALSPPAVLLMLFSGRITSSYLKQIQETAFEIKKRFKQMTSENLKVIFDFMDARLKIHQSRIYIESSFETTQILDNSSFPEIINDPELFTDARALTPPECQEIATLMKKLSDRQATDLIIDEVEDLSQTPSKNSI